jgi:hypothetical protein
VVMVAVWFVVFVAGAALLLLGVALWVLRR